MQNKDQDLNKIPAPNKSGVEKFDKEALRAVFEKVFSAEVVNDYLRKYTESERPDRQAKLKDTLVELSSLLSEKAAKGELAVNEEGVVLDAACDFLESKRYGRLVKIVKGEEVGLVGEDFVKEVEAAGMDAGTESVQEQESQESTEKVDGDPLGIKSEARMDAAIGEETEDDKFKKELEVTDIEQVDKQDTPEGESKQEERVEEDELDSPEKVNREFFHKMKLDPDKIYVNSKDGRQMKVVGFADNMVQVVFLPAGTKKDEEGVNVIKLDSDWEEGIDEKQMKLSAFLAMMREYDEARESDLSVESKDLDSEAVVDRSESIEFQDLEKEKGEVVGLDELLDLFGVAGSIYQTADAAENLEVVSYLYRKEDTKWDIKIKESKEGKTRKVSPEELQNLLADRYTESNFTPKSEEKMEKADYEAFRTEFGRTREYVYENAQAGGPFVITKLKFSKQRRQNQIKLEFIEKKASTWTSHEGIKGFLKTGNDGSYLRTLTENYDPTKKDKDNKQEENPEDGALVVAGEIRPEAKKQEKFDDPDVIDVEWTEVEAREKENKETLGLRNDEEERFEKELKRRAEAKEEKEEEKGDSKKDNKETLGLRNDEEERLAKEAESRLANDESKKIDDENLIKGNKKETLGLRDDEEERLAKDAESRADAKKEAEQEKGVVPKVFEPEIIEDDSMGSDEDIIDAEFEEIKKPAMIEHQELEPGPEKEKQDEMNAKFEAWKEAEVNYQKKANKLSIVKKGLAKLGIAFGDDFEAMKELRSTKEKMKNAEKEFKAAHSEFSELTAQKRKDALKHSNFKKKEEKKLMGEYLSTEKVVENEKVTSEGEKIVEKITLIEDLHNKMLELNEAKRQALSEKERGIVAKVYERYKKLSRKQKVAIGFGIAGTIGFTSALVGGAAVGTAMGAGASSGALRLVRSLVGGAASMEVFKTATDKLSISRDDRKEKVEHKAMGDYLKGKDMDLVTMMQKKMNMERNDNIKAMAAAGITGFAVGGTIKGLTELPFIDNDIETGLDDSGTAPVEEAPSGHLDAEAQMLIGKQIAEKMGVEFDPKNSDVAIGVINGEKVSMEFLTEEQQESVLATRQERAIAGKYNLTQEDLEMIADMNLIKAHEIMNNAAALAKQMEVDFVSATAEVMEEAGVPTMINGQEVPMELLTEQQRQSVALFRESGGSPKQVSLERRVPSRDEILQTTQSAEEGVVVGEKINLAELGPEDQMFARGCSNFEERGFQETDAYKRFQAKYGPEQRTKFMEAQSDGTDEGNKQAERMWDKKVRRGERAYLMRAETEMQQIMAGQFAEKMGIKFDPDNNEIFSEANVPTVIDGQKVPMELLTEKQQRGVMFARQMRASSGDYVLTKEDAEMIADFKLADAQKIMDSAAKIAEQMELEFDPATAEVMQTAGVPTMINGQEVPMELLTEQQQKSINFARDLGDLPEKVSLERVVPPYGEDSQLGRAEDNVVRDGAQEGVPANETKILTAEELSAKLKELQVNEKDGAWRALRTMTLKELEDFPRTERAGTAAWKTGGLKLPAEATATLGYVDIREAGRMARMAGIVLKELEGVKIDHPERVLLENALKGDYTPTEEIIEQQDPPLPPEDSGEIVSGKETAHRGLEGDLGEQIAVAEDLSQAPETIAKEELGEGVAAEEETLKILDIKLKKGEDVWKKVAEHYEGDQAETAKAMVAFEKGVTQELLEKGMNKAQAKEFVDWRFRHLQVGQPVRLDENGLAISGFVDSKTIASFNERNLDNLLDDEQEQLVADTTDVNEDSSANMELIQAGVNDRLAEAGIEINSSTWRLAKEISLAKLLEEIPPTDQDIAAAWDARETVIDLEELKGGFSGEVTYEQFVELQKISNMMSALKPSSVELSMSLDDYLKQSVSQGIEGEEMIAQNAGSMPRTETGVEDSIASSEVTADNFLDRITDKERALFADTEGQEFLDSVQEVANKVKGTRVQAAQFYNENKIGIETADSIFSTVGFSEKNISTSIIAYLEQGNSLTTKQVKGLASLIENVETLKTVSTA